MPEHHPGPGRPHPPTAVAILLSLLTVLTLLATLPGTAAAVDGDKSRPTHPEQDWMGSTVRAHEGERGPAAKGSSARDLSRAGSASVDGVDVSSHNGHVSWSKLWNKGVRFAYAKATEGTSYTNPNFAQQYNGPYDAGMIRGAYHFALPGNSSGGAQADYFVHHGGGWTDDGWTLPGVLDMEYNPYGSACYGLSKGRMVDWIEDFLDAYRDHTGRDAAIYTSTAWWKKCTGNHGGFGRYNPLWVPRYGSSSGELPNGWDFYTFWQHTSTGPTVGDHDRFNGSYNRLEALAYG
ncbi:lysozyme [Streptomyces roseoverticillatus]|uniref:lysozyme n=1 Tax=Streptomyces roseoverticillatus TaxID=66429 RepID=UPI001F3CD92F|nr:lysozyme [Streptomyces roseoverticillatus]MCF3103228.1 lysozyme [Streptomyces roseoverticillatus]